MLSRISFLLSLFFCLSLHSNESSLTIQQQIERLQRFGVTQRQARETFQAAQIQVPRIQQLQQRGGREVAEEDLFDVEDFTEAAVFRTPEELEQVRVLEAEEETRFTPLTGPARRGGRVTGLTQQ